MENYLCGHRKSAPLYVMWIIPLFRHFDIVSLCKASNLQSGMGLIGTLLHRLIRIHTNRMDQRRVSEGKNIVWHCPKHERDK